jgi:hypothetical protein
VRLPIVGALGADFAGVIVIGGADIEVEGPSDGRSPAAAVSSEAGCVENFTLLKLVQA